MRIKVITLVDFEQYILQWPKAYKDNWFNDNKMPGGIADVEVISSPVSEEALYIRGALVYSDNMMKKFFGPVMSVWENIVLPIKIDGKKEKYIRIVDLGNKKIWADIDYDYSQ